MCALNNLISTEDCEEVLRNYLAIKEWNLTSFTIDSLSETIEGMLGEHYLLEIQYKTGNNDARKQRFFLKMLNGKNNVLTELTKELYLFEKEELVYTHLRKLYSTDNLDVSYMPECYLFKPHMIVLEDLSLRNYKTTQKKIPFDLHHCKIALKTLAKFHGSHIIYAKNNSINLLEKFPGLFEEKIFAKRENPASKWLKCSVDGLLGLIAHLDLPSERKTDFTEKFQACFDNIYEYVKPNDKHVCTILHGDLWSNNFLFKYDDDDKPVDSILIDYQILRFGSPAIDVLQMIFTNTRKVLRDEIYNDLLEIYYSYLAETLDNGGINCSELLPRNDFLDVCREVRAAVKLQAIADRSITFLSDESYGEALITEDSLRMFLFENRSKCIIDSFLNNAEFREIIREDLMDFLDILSTQ